MIVPTILDQRPNVAQGLEAHYNEACITRSYDGMFRDDQCHCCNVACADTNHAGSNRDQVDQRDFPLPGQRRHRRSSHNLRIGRGKGC